jgi:hypothetical protein
MFVSYLVKFPEEFLVEDEGDAGYFLDTCLRLGALVDEVGRNSDGQFSPELLAAKALKGVAFSIGADQAIDLELGHRVVLGDGFGAPPRVAFARRDQSFERNANVHLHPQQQSRLQQNHLKEAHHETEWMT